MGEYISKDELRLMRTEECEGHTIEYAMGWKACIEYLRGLPNADVVRCFRANWLPYEVANTEEEQVIAWQCSNCEEVVSARSNFCPNCGLEMKAGK